MEGRFRQPATRRWRLARITVAGSLRFGWSRGLFPHPDAEQSPPSTHRRVNLARFCMLVLAAGLLCFTRLHCPLLEPDEARYAEIPRQMLAEGRLVVPVLHGQPYLDKPPLLYWLVMASYTVFGVHDWAARLVPCGAAFLSILVTYGWGRRLLGQRAAFLGAFVLCLSARFVYLGRMLAMDSLLCLWVVAALAAAHVALSGPRLSWRWWLLSAFVSGLGVLTKGPVALVLVAVPVLAYQLLDARPARVRLWAWFVYVLLAAGLAGPWYLAAVATDAEFAGHFFWKHNVLRYLAPFDHEEPLWFYLPGLLLGMLPWTLLLWPLAKLLWRRSAQTGSRRPAALGFFLLCSLWCLVFYSLAGCKRPGYILPVMPPLALALGCYLNGVLPKGAVHPLGVALIAQRHPAASWALWGATMFVVLFVGIHQLLPAYARKFSLRGQVRRHFDLTADPHIPVVCYPRRWDSVSFYLRRDDVRVYTPDQRRLLAAHLRDQPRTLVFAKSIHLEELLADLPASLEFVPQGRQGMLTVGWIQPRAEPAPYLLADR